MKIIIDENIIFAKEAFSALGNTRLVDGRKLTNTELKDADILIVRSITQVNEKLLENTNVKFVGTATIGTDHIDLDYLKNHNIQFADAKGCNADSVAEYIFTALLKIASSNNISLKQKTIGVIGVGNIGSRVVRLAESLGMNVLKNDPPLQRKGIDENYVSLDEILKADIITIHVPLYSEGIDKTLHLLNEENLKKIKKGTIIINTSRGAVVDNTALLAEANKKEFQIILDVWENESSINTKLLTKTSIATPHIAGYSFEGKINGTKMIYDALYKFLDREATWSPTLPNIETSELKLPDSKSEEEKLYKLFSSIYKIENDDELIRRITNYDQDKQANYFDNLRKKYPLRHEFSNYTILLEKCEKDLKSILESFRFKAKVL